MTTLQHERRLDKDRRLRHDLRRSDDPTTVVRKEEVELREEVGEIGENLYLDIQSGCDPPVVGASLSVL